jgi:hypothetical protein
MNKYLKRGLIVTTIVATLSGTFVLGVSAATNGWKDKILVKANKSIGEAGYAKKEALINNIDTAIEQKINAEYDGTIEQKEREVEQELDAYFNSKVDELTDTPEFDGIEGELDNVVDTVANRYKAEIDQAFEGK